MNSDGIDRTIVSWRAWYTGGRTFHSMTTCWKDLPEIGVLCVVIYYRTRPYRRSMSGSSLYWLEDTPEGPVFGYDDAADAIIPDEVYQKGCVKRGKWVTDEEMAEVTIQVQKASIAPNEGERVNKN